MRLVAAIAENPVLVKELRVRMRGARAYWILTGYLAFISLILFFMYVEWWTTAQHSGGMSSGSKVGQQFFYVIMAVQGFLVAFITPAVTSGAITIEREQRTMEMLTMTRMSRGAIVAGKLFSAISFVALLLISSIPLTSICFLLGGVSPDQVVNAYAMLLASAFIAGALGLAWSSVAKTTAAAVIFTYSTLVGPPLILSFALGIAFAGTLGGSLGSGGGASVAAMSVFQIGGLFGLSMGMLGSGTPFTSWGLPHYYGVMAPVWVAPVATYALIGLILAAVATARLETFPERRAGLLRALVAAFVAEQCFFLFGGWFSTYSASAISSSWGMWLTTPLPVLVFPILLLMLVAAIFCTGELRPSEAREFGKYLLRGWTHHGMKRGRLNSALPYMLALAVLVIGMYAASFALVGRSSSILSGRIAPSSAAMTAIATMPAPPFQQNPGMPRVPAPTAAAVALAQNTPRGGFWPVCAVALTTMLSVWAFGFLVSVVVRSRWASLALVLAAMLGVLIAPGMAHLAWLSDFLHRPPAPLINLYYLNPVIAILHLAEPVGHSWDQLPLAFRGAPIWVVTICTQLIVSGVCLLLAVPFVRSLAARRTAEHDDLAATI